MHPATRRIHLRRPSRLSVTMKIESAGWKSFAVGPGIFIERGNRAAADLKRIQRSILQRQFAFSCSMMGTRWSPAIAKLLTGPRSIAIIAPSGTKQLNHWIKINRPSRRVNNYSKITVETRSRFAGNCARVADRSKSSRRGRCTSANFARR